MKALMLILIAFGFFVGYLTIEDSATTDAVPKEVTGVALEIVNFGSFVSASILQVLVVKLLDLKWEGTFSQGARVFSKGAYQSGFVIVLGVVLTAIVGAAVFSTKVGVPEAKNKA